MTDVFISYARQDRERVRPIAEALGARGLDVWWDVEIRPGREFRDEIAEALDTAKAMIVVWSQYSTVSRFVRDEADEGARRNILFPVLLDLVDIPYGFRQIQTVDLTRWRGGQRNDAFVALVEAITDFVTASAASERATTEQETAIAPSGRSRFSITGTMARLHLFWSALGLAALVAAISLPLWLFVISTSSPVRGLVLTDRALKQAAPLSMVLSNLRVWITSAQIGGVAFVLTLFARVLTLAADSIFGSVSLRPISRSIVCAGLVAALITAPAELQVRISSKLFTSPLYWACFSPDGREVVTASEDGSVQIWSSKTGKLIFGLDNQKSAVTSVAFSPDGSKLVTSSEDGDARVWSSSNGKLLRTLPANNGPIWNVTFSPDGSKIVSASNNGTVQVWDATTGRLLTIFRLKSTVNSVAFSPDGTKIITTSRDNTARIWNAAGGKLLLTLSGHTDWVKSASFSPDGSKVVTASDDHTARVWSSADGKLLLILKGHTGWVESAEFSPDGKNILTASADKTACIWNAATGKLLISFRGHEGIIWNAAFSPDASKVVTASADGSARIWNAKTGAMQTEIIPHGPKPVIAVPTRLSQALVGPVGSALDILNAGRIPWRDLVLRGAALALTAIFFAALARALGRIVLKPEFVHGVATTSLSAAVIYILFVYLTNLPAESLLIWLVLAFLATPLVALARLILALLMRPAFTAANQR